MKNIECLSLRSLTQIPLMVVLLIDYLLSSSNKHLIKRNYLFIKAVHFMDKISHSRFLSKKNKKWASLFSSFLYSKIRSCN